MYHTTHNKVKYEQSMELQNYRTRVGEIIIRSIPWLTRRTVIAGLTLWHSYHPLYRAAPLINVTTSTRFQRGNVLMHFAHTVSCGDISITLFGSCWFDCRIPRKTSLRWIRGKWNVMFSSTNNSWRKVCYASRTLRLPLVIIFMNLYIIPTAIILRLI